jgi:hypothetical protein
MLDVAWMLLHQYWRLPCVYLNPWQLELALPCSPVASRPRSTHETPSPDLAPEAGPRGEQRTWLQAEGTGS